MQQPPNLPSRSSNSLLVKISEFGISNITGLQLFQLIRYAAFLLVAVLLVKFGLTSSDIGIYETFILISGFFSFWVSGLLNSLLSLFHEKNDSEKSTLLFNAFILLIFFNLIATLILILLYPVITQYLIKPSDNNYLSYIIAYMFINNPGFLIEYIYLLRNRPKQIVRYGIIIFIILILGALIPLILNLGITGIFAGLIVFASIKLIWLIVLVYKETIPKVNINLLKQHLTIGLPLVASILLSGSAEYIDGFIIKFFRSDEAFAIFRYGARELPVVLLIANAFSIATIPLIAKNLYSGMDEIKVQSKKMMHLLFPITIILLGISYWIFPFVFSAEYQYSAFIFSIYLLLIIPRLVFPQTVLVGMKQAKYLLISSLLELIINIVLSIFLLHHYGLAGVALATFIAFSFDKIFLGSLLLIKFSIKPTQYVDFKYLTIYSGLLILIFSGVYKYFYY